MPLIILARLMFSVFSLGLLAAGIYLAWSWYEGAWLLDQAGRAYQVREDWRLWAGGALLAWSLLGRFALLPLLARPDTDPTRSQRTGALDAPPVILTHGWGLDATIWFYLRRELAKRFRVIAWDLPGLGKSRGKVGLEDFAVDLEALLSLTGGRRRPGGPQHRRHDPPDAGARPSRKSWTGSVAGLVLVNTTYTNPLRTMVLSGLAQALRWPVLEPMFRLTIWLQPLAWLSAWQSYLSGSAHMANRIGFASEVTRSQLEHNTLLATRNPPAASARGNLAMFRWDAEGALQA
jgi:hypothetical protein